MTTDNLSLFQGLYSKMHYLGQRQKVLAQNIANADTPGYKPKDIQQPDFKKILGNTTSSLSLNGQASNVSLKHTSAGHLSLGGGQGRAEARETRETYETSPDGNAVILEEQMLKANETMQDHRLMSNIHEKYLSMVRAATGNNR